MYAEILVGETTAEQSKNVAPSRGDEIDRTGGNESPPLVPTAAQSNNEP